ncbi:MAG: DUF5615 family PIN-like protein [Chloroflexota bacterium]|nr:DUF5615 family PIN-like protein [Chloroflexota bacterium]
MKFLADMGISPHCVAFLRERGYQATHLYEIGLERMSDANILEKARRENFVVLTHDLDFGELIAISGAKLPSVVTFRLRNMKPNNVNRYLQNLVSQHQDALEEGAVFSVTENYIRVRKLPIK